MSKIQILATNIVNEYASVYCLVADKNTIEQVAPGVKGALPFCINGKHEYLKKLFNVNDIYDIEQLIYKYVEGNVRFGFNQEKRQKYYYISNLNYITE